LDRECERQLLGTVAHGEWSEVDFERTQRQQGAKWIAPRTVDRSARITVAVDPCQKLRRQSDVPLVALTKRCRTACGDMRVHGGCGSVTIPTLGDGGALKNAHAREDDRCADRTPRTSG
jgi:hypothetical protein